MAKKVIIPIIIVLLLGVGGVFWWWQEYQENKKFGEMTVGELLHFRVLPKGFTIDEIPDYKVLTNKDLGINFSVLADWEVVGYMDNFIDLKSPDYKVDPETFDRIKGCLITVEVSYYTLFTSSNLINRIDQIQKGNIQSENEEVIKISGHDALKTIRKGEWLSKEGIKEIIEVGIPFVDAKAEVKFSTKIFENEIKCTQEFDKFLETLSIQ